MADWFALIPGQKMPRKNLPRLDMQEFRLDLIARVREGARLVALFGYPVAGNSTAETTGMTPSPAGNPGAAGVALVAIVTGREPGHLDLAETLVGSEYPALTPDCPPAHWFEREIAEQWGIKPIGHPWLKPIRFHPSYLPGQDAWGRPEGAEILPCVTDFYRVEGEEIHEVAVGPVHAGVIEPGHFRFQCHGEKVFHLEISLGYQHRGVERALIGGPDARSWHLMQTLAGDTTTGHATAYAEILEALGGYQAPARGVFLRGLGLELERLANHVGDLGALAGDVGFLPTMSYCGRLRGDFLNLTALVCGNRFGRGLVRPGGAGFDLDAERIQSFLQRFEPVVADTAGAINLLWTSTSVIARFEETGRVTRETARDLGLVGVAARACGLEQDVRGDFPHGVYRYFQAPVSVWPSGDVFARAYVRWLEIQRSEALIRDLLNGFPPGPIEAPEKRAPEPDSLAVTLVEGWRGEICHVAFTDPRGRFAWYKVIDPSFHNWMGLALSLRNQEISDFPLCNKSFNLSYCGHDL